MSRQIRYTHVKFENFVKLVEEYLNCNKKTKYLDGVMCYYKGSCISGEVIIDIALEHRECYDFAEIAAKLL